MLFFGQIHPSRQVHLNWRSLACTDELKVLVTVVELSSQLRDSRTKGHEDVTFSMSLQLLGIFVLT